MSDAKWLTFQWTPGHQEIAVDGVSFSHPEPTGTAPSHDIAHLLAAASGLAWRPSGERDDVCRAEFNAVFLEHLGISVFDSVALGRGGGSVLNRTLEHVRWFAEEHYAPFPDTFDAAVARFCKCVNVEAVARLSPIFFRTRAFELEHPDFALRSFGARFSSCFRPPVCGVPAELQVALFQEVAALTTHACLMPCGAREHA